MRRKKSDNYVDKYRMVIAYNSSMNSVASDRTEPTSVATSVIDDYRRYGNLLFEDCHEVDRAVQRGRLPKVLREKVTVWFKNLKCHNLANGPSVSG